MSGFGIKTASTKGLVSPSKGGLWLYIYRVYWEKICPDGAAARWKIIVTQYTQKCNMKHINAAKVI